MVQAQAAAAARAAEVLERKAAYARSRAESFAKGAEGEQRLAATLASLTVDGSHVLHDRALPSGGNIDHLVVGPSGILVLDAKHWSTPVTIDAGLRVGRWDKTGAIDQITSAVAEVRATLASSRLAVPTAGLLVLTHDVNADRRPELVDGVVVLGISHVVSALAARPRELSTQHVDSALAHMLTAFPHEGGAVPTIPDHEDDAHPLFKKANSYLYVTPWSRGGRHRLYVSGPDGQTYGYKDTLAGTVAVTESRMDPVLRGVLANATATSLGFSREDIPKVPTELPGARILGKLGQMWMTFLVGHRWRKGSMDRLYGWRLNPTDGIADLGFVDLNTGRLHPKHEKPLGKDLGTPERYLLRLRENFTAGRR
jgi:hypothetical protein